MRPLVLLRRPLLWGLLYAALIAYGIYALWRIPAEVLPRFDFPQIGIVVHAPGYSALEMESLVARPLEGQIMGLQGMTNLRTTLSQGTAQLTARFDEGRDPEQALQAVYGAIDRAQGKLPAGITPYAEVMGNAVNEVADYGVVVPAGHPAWQIENAIRTRVLPALRALPGVQRIELFGAGPPTLWIQPKPAALVQHHVGVEALARAVGAAVTLAPAGHLDLGHQNVLLEVRRLPETAQALLDIPVATSGGPVPLSALARVVNNPPQIRYGLEVDGKPGLGLIVFKQPGASTIPVDSAVAATLARLRDQLPAGTRWIPVYRQAHLVSVIGHDLGRNLAIGGVLAVLVLLLILGRRHGVGILALSIPVALLLAIGALYAMGQTLNLLTLGALTVSVGLLADDGIIVVEAIRQRWETGSAGWEGVRAGVSDIATADITGTLTTVAAYLPLIAIGGLAGLFTRPFALAMSLALIASLLVSLTLIPLLSARRDRGGDAPALGRGFLALLSRGNDRLLNLTLRFPIASVAVTCIVFALSIAALFYVPMNFLPLPNEGVLLDGFSLPPGSSVDQTVATVDRMTAAMRTDPAVAHVFARIGSAKNTAYVENSFAGEIQIVLKPDVSANSLDRVAAKLRRLAHQPGVQQSFDTPTIERLGESLSGLPQAFELTLFGNRIDTLRRLSKSITRRLKTVPALTDIFNNDAYPVTQLIIRPRPEILRASDLTAAQLSGQLRLLLGGQVLARLPEGNSHLDLYLRLPDAPYLGLGALARQPIRTPTGWVPLGRLARLDLTAEPSQLRHIDGARALEILATPLGPLGSTVDAGKQALSGLKLPPGYRIAFGGLYRELLHTAAGLGLAAVGALLLTLGILALQFGGLRLPLILLLQAPLAFTGAVLALAVSKVGLNATSLIGFLTLIGVSLNHGIVLLTYVRVHEKEGATPEAAVRRAVHERMRPIVLTTLAAALGMLPTALGYGTGAAPEQGLAIVVMGGVLWSAVQSTNLLPALYLRWGTRSRSGT